MKLSKIRDSLRRVHYSEETRQRLVRVMAMRNRARYAMLVLIAVDLIVRAPRNPLFILFTCACFAYIVVVLWKARSLNKLFKESARRDRERMLQQAATADADALDS